MVTYERPEFLKKSIDMFAENTNHPYKMWVVSNSEQKETIDILKDAKLKGKIFEYIISPSNDGYTAAFQLAMDEIEKRGEETEFVISTEDDMWPPLLNSRKDIDADWMSQLIYEFNKDERWGSLALRLDRTRRVDIDESKSKVRHYKSAPSTIRCMRTNDLKDSGIRLGLRKHWSTQEFGDLFRSIGKRFGVTTHIYMCHSSYDSENKGYGERNDHLTFSTNHISQGEEQPKPDLDEKTFIPVSINSSRDSAEQELRDEYWANVGKQNKVETKKKSNQRALLGEIAEKEANGGLILDLGCGNAKVSDAENCVGIDLWSYPNSTDIVAGIEDLFFIPKNSVSVICSCHSLEHASIDTKSVLMEWDRTLIPGGIMAIILPDGEYRNGKSICEKSHKVCLSKGTMKWILHYLMGYKIERLENISFLREPAKAFIIVARKPISAPVSRPVPLAAYPSYFTIVSATYGTSEKSIDVKAAIESLVSQGKEVIVSFKATALKVIPGVKEKA